MSRVAFCILKMSLLASDREERKQKRREQNRFMGCVQFKDVSQFISRVRLPRRPSPVDGQRGSTCPLSLFFGALRVVRSSHSGEVRK